MMWFADGFGWGWMLFGGLMMVLFWGGLIALAIVILRAFSGDASDSKRDETSGRARGLQILEERYALGEISKQEFEITRADITG